MWKMLLTVFFFSYVQTTVRNPKNLQSHHVINDKKAAKTIVAAFYTKKPELDLIELLWINLNITGMT